MLLPHIATPLINSSSRLHRSTMNNSAPSYGDAEKGMIDVNAHGTVVVPTFPKQSPDYPLDEKKPSYEPASKFEPPKEKKDTPAPPPAKPTPKPKKKVSKWILWKLWFNTYR